MRVFISVCLIFFLPVKAFLQDSLIKISVQMANPSASVLLKEVIISGNQKTRPSTILRELEFEAGQKYPLEVLNERLTAAEAMLMNTGLFRKAIVKLKVLSPTEAVVSIDVEERWYIYPIPFIRPVDNSFMQWVTQQDRDFDRINYGIRLTHHNLTGRGDRLQVKFMNGFTRLVGVHYNNLFLDGQMKWFTNMGFDYGNNRAVDYKTDHNKLVPLKTPDDDFVHSFVKAYAEINFRKEMKTTHTLGIGFSRDNVADTVYQLNPEYNFDQDRKGFGDIYYRVAYANVDFIPYPTKGYLATASITKKGLGSDMNLWQLTAKTSATWPAGMP